MIWAVPGALNFTLLEISQGKHTRTMRPVRQQHGVGLARG